MGGLERPSTIEDKQFHLAVICESSEILTNQNDRMKAGQPKIKTFLHKDAF